MSSESDEGQRKIRSRSPKRSDRGSGKRPARNSSLYSRNEKKQFDEQFKVFPNIDPITYKPIKIPSGKFTKSVQLYGQPYDIIDIETDQPIKVGGKRFKELLKHYPIDQVLYGEVKLKPTYSGLTEINDINFQILEHMDIETLSNYCMINEYALEFCNHSTLWIKKLNDQGFRYVPKSPTTTVEWIKLYKELMKAKENAERILIINEINEINEDEGILIKSSRFGKILSYFVDETYKGKITIEIFLGMDDDGYIVNINDQDYDFNKKHVIELLTYALYVNIAVTDDLGLPYIIDHSTIDQYDPILYDHNLDYESRKTILKTLNYLKDNHLCKI